MGLFDRDSNKDALNKVDLTRHGRTGLDHSFGRIREDFLSEFDIAKMKEMSRNDPVVGASLRAYEMVARQADWRVVPASQDRADRRRAKFLESAFKDMSLSWEDTVSEILSMFEFGFSYHEILFKRRTGYDRDPSRSSRFNDGRIGWAKFASRSQDSLKKWEFSEADDVIAFIQRDGTEEHRIPMWKSLLFRTTVRKNNPEGRSILRTSYRPYKIKKFIEEKEAIGVERDLVGIPKVFVPAEYLTDNATDAQASTVSRMETIAEDLRQDQSATAVLPAAFDDESGERLFDITMFTSPGQKQFDTSRIIDRWDRRIAMSMLADFIILGQGQTGSFALSESKTNIFQMAVEGYLDHVKSVVNRKAVPQLFRVNNMSTSNLPTWTYDEPETASLRDMALFVSRMAGAGAITPDDQLEERIRDLAGFPPRDQATERSTPGTAGRGIQGDGTPAGDED